MGSTSLLNVISLAAANVTTFIMKRTATTRTNRIVVLRSVFGSAGNKRKAKIKNHHILRPSFVRTTELLAVDQFEVRGSRCFSQVRRRTEPLPKRRGSINGNQLRVIHCTIPPPRIQIEPLPFLELANIAIEQDAPCLSKQRWGR
jgi:hypothetical protein